MDVIRAKICGFNRLQFKALRRVYANTRVADSVVHCNFKSKLQAFRKLKLQSGVIARIVWERNKRKKVFRRLRTNVRRAMRERGEER